MIRNFVLFASFSLVFLAFLSLSVSLSLSGRRVRSFDDDDDDDAEYLRSTFMKHITHNTQNNRTILSRTRNALPFPRFRAHAGSVGMDLPYRQRFQFLLELIYGDTFKPKAFWADTRTRTSFSTRCLVAKPDCENRVRRRC